MSGPGLAPVPKKILLVRVRRGGLRTLALGGNSALSTEGNDGRTLITAFRKYKFLHVRTWRAGPQTLALGGVWGVYGMKVRSYKKKEESECENGGAATNGALGVTGYTQRCSAVGRAVTVTVTVPDTSSGAVVSAVRGGVRDSVRIPLVRSHRVIFSDQQKPQYC